MTPIGANIVDIPTKESTMQITELQDRTIITHDGLPALVKLHTREATSAPARLKATLTVDAPCEKHGTHELPLPFAQAGPLFTTEFRLEQN